MKVGIGKWDDGKDIRAVAVEALCREQAHETVVHVLATLATIACLVTIVSVFLGSLVCTCTCNLSIEETGCILVIALPQIELTKQHSYWNKQALCLDLGTVVAITELEDLTVLVPCWHWICCRILIRDDIGNELVDNLIAGKHWLVHHILGSTVCEDWLCKIWYVVVVDCELQVCPCADTLDSNVFGKHQLDVVLLESSINTCQIDVTVVDDSIVVLDIEVLVGLEIEH